MLTSQRGERAMHSYIKGMGRRGGGVCMAQPGGYYQVLAE